MHNFREMIVWQRAHALVLKIYKISQSLPQSENFGLVLNLRRSAISMATRIAEGSGKGTAAELDVEFMRARATGYELEYLVLVAHDLGFLKDEVHESLTQDVIEVRKLISGFLRRSRVAP